MRAAILVAIFMLMSQAALAGKDVLLKYDFHLSWSNDTNWPNIVTEEIILHVDELSAHGGSGKELRSGDPFQVVRYGGLACMVFQQKHTGKTPEGPWGNAQSKMYCFKPMGSFANGFSSGCGYNYRGLDCGYGHAETSLSRTKRGQ